MDPVDASQAAGMWLWRVNPGDEFTLPTLLKGPVFNDEWDAFATLVGDRVSITNGNNVGDVTGNGLPDFMGHDTYGYGEWRLYEGGAEGEIDALHDARLRILKEGKSGYTMQAADIDGNGVSDFLMSDTGKTMLFMNPPLRPK